MTAKEIEEKLNNELGLSEIMEITYNEKNKDLYLYIWISFENEIIRNHNPKFIKALEDITSFDLGCLDNIPLEKFPGFKLKIYNKNNTFNIVPDYIPTADLETYTFTSLEKIFGEVLKTWGVI